MSIWTKDQHFVPQMYLRLFSHDQKNIWVYDSLSGSIQVQRIKDTGFIKWFYRSRAHPAPMEIPEVSSLEGQAKTTIQKIEKREEVSPEELGKLLNFVILQFLRTPAARKRSEAVFKLFWSELRSRYRSAGLAGRENAEKIAESFLKDQKIQSTPRAFLESDGLIEMPAEFFIQSIPSAGHSLMEKLGAQGWEFLSAEDEEFITSDDPFSMTGREEGDSTGISIGEDSYKIIPLSKKVCLAIDGDKRQIIVKRMLPWAVKVINLGIANLADRYVYASSELQLKEVSADLPKFKTDPDSFTPKEIDRSA